MSIDDGFKKLLEGVRLADEGRDVIMRGLEDAWAGRKDLDQQLHDLRETVTSLEALIFEQSRKIDALRQRLDAGGTAMTDHDHDAAIGALRAHD